MLIFDKNDSAAIVVHLFIIERIMSTMNVVYIQES